jgi:hypothetical protein
MWLSRGVIAMPCIACRDSGLVEVCPNSPREPDFSAILLVSPPSRGVVGGRVLR